MNDELRKLLIETRDHLIRTKQAVIELQAEVLKLKAMAAECERQASAQEICSGEAMIAAGIDVRAKSSSLAPTGRARPLRKWWRESTRLWSQQDASGIR
jgi:hypothetical protein